MRRIGWWNVEIRRRGARWRWCAIRAGLCHKVGWAESYAAARRAAWRSL